MKRTNEIRDLTREELQHELENRQKEYFNLRFQAATEQMEKATEMRRVRRDIARIKTILHQRDLVQPQAATEKAK